MKRYERIVATLPLLVLACVSSSPEQDRAAQLALVGVTVIDIAGESPMPDSSIIIRNGRITAVGPMNQIRVPLGTPVVDGDGLFVIPGLWDMHTHLWEADLLFPLHIANGITGIRDMGSRLEEWEGWKKEVAAGERLGPRAIVAGRIIDALDPLYFGWVEADEASQARDIVKTLSTNGVDFIKIYDRITAEVFDAIVDEARREGLPVTGHVPTEIAASEAARRGMKSMEHLIGIALECSANEETLRKDALALLGGIRSSDLSQQELFGQLARYYATIRYEPQSSYDSEKSMRLFEILREQGTWQVPTLVVRRVLTDEQRMALSAQLDYFPGFLRGLVLPESEQSQEELDKERRRFEFRKHLVRQLHRAGVKLLAGSDGGNPGTVPGFSLHDELELLVEAGLEPSEALACATRNAAEYLGRLHDFGTIEEGKMADLVILEGSPLEDIRNTRRISSVVLGGELLDRNDLDRMLTLARPVD